MFEQLMSHTALPNLHPVFVHFPVALLMTALALDLVVVAVRKWIWLDRAATLLYALGAVGSLAAYLSGRSAASSIHGLTGAADAAMWDHGDWALVTTVAFGVIAMLRLVVERRDARHGSIAIGPLRAAVLVAATGGQALIYQTADRGGALVFKHAISVTDDATPHATENASKP